MHRLCAADEIEGGEVRTLMLPREPGTPPREVMVLRDHGGELRAYLNRCAHIPIPLDGGSRLFFDPKKRYLRCGTHGALFRMEDGYCIVGPCKGEWLVPWPIVVEEGEIRIPEEANLVEIRGGSQGVQSSERSESSESSEEAG